MNNISQYKIGVFATVNRIKIDFLSWNRKLIKPPIIYHKIRLLSLEDIAAMKIFAILQRGEKKDSIYTCELIKIYSLNEIITFYNLKYNASNALLIIRYLTSTSDIENQPLPNILNDINWEDYKLIINHSIKSYLI